MKLPDALPSASNIANAADTLENALSALDPTITNITATWKGLYNAYHAPEADTVYSALAPLNTVPDELVATLGKAATALRNYATTLRGLAARRITLLSERAELMRPEAGADPQYYNRGVTYNAKIDAFNSDASLADADCASALKALRSHISWNISAALQLPNGVLGGTAQGLGAELLNRYRGRLLVPGPGAVIPDIPRVAEIVPEEFFKGKPYSALPSGFLVDPKHLPSATPLPILDTKPPGWRQHLVFTDGPESLGSPPPWARWGGRTLGVAGAGLTLWGTYTDSYNDTLTRHPEWSEDQRQSEAAVDTAVVGGSAVGIGALGAWGGAAAGAAIGSVFPGPGTLIGGIIGGVIGGVAGGWTGQTVSQELTDEVRGDK